MFLNSGYIHITDDKYISYFTKLFNIDLNMEYRYVLKYKKENKMITNNELNSLKHVIVEEIEKNKYAITVYTDVEDKKQLNTRRDYVKYLENMLSKTDTDILKLDDKELTVLCRIISNKIENDESLIKRLDIWETNEYELIKVKKEEVVMLNILLDKIGLKVSNLADKQINDINEKWESINNQSVSSNLPYVNMLNKMIEKDYKSFVTSLIFIEKEIDDPTILDDMYNKYMNNDFNLLNDSFTEDLEL